jgi:hypothetical protein
MQFATPICFRHVQDVSILIRTADVILPFPFKNISRNDNDNATFILIVFFFESHDFVTF